MRVNYFALPNKIPNLGTRTILEVEPNSGLEGGLFWIKEAKLAVKMKEEGVRGEDRGKEGRIVGKREEDRGKEKGLQLQFRRWALLWKPLMCPVGLFQTTNPQTLKLQGWPLLRAGAP